MYVSGLPAPCFDLKKNLKSIWFFYQKLVGQDLGQAQRVFQALKRTFMLVSGLPLPYVNLKIIL